MFPSDVRAERSSTLSPIDATSPLSVEGRAYAESIGVTDVESVYRDFVDYNLSAGKVSADWEATWRRWCTRALNLQRHDRERARGRGAPVQRDEPGTKRAWTVPEVHYVGRAKPQ